MPDAPKKKVPDERDREKLKRARATALPAPAGDSGSVNWTRIRPLNGRMILRVGDEIAHHGVIEVPDANRERSPVNTIVAIAPGDHQFKPGDRIQLCQRAWTRPFRDENREYMWSRIEDIAVLMPPVGS